MLFPGLRHSSHTQALALNARPVVAAVTSGLRTASVRHSSSKPKVLPTFLDFNLRVQVAILGASGGIGQPLALLLKQDPLIAELSLYSRVGTNGVAADLSHIDSKARVTVC